MKKPELNIPAGNMEKLKIALNYGADAVYCGIKDLSLRNFANNFTIFELSDATGIAHTMGKKVFVTLNIFGRNHHLPALPAMLEELARINIDALIISDPGFITFAQRYAPNIPIFLSTQMNVTNIESVLFWQKFGIKRIILARELSLSEIKEIRNSTDIELEVFVHGSMCIAYSGRCIMSSYMSSRSANLGECTQPCRWNYKIMEEKRPGEYFPIVEEDGWTNILSSKDLCMIEHIPELVNSGVDAFKVEGRMRGLLYLAAVTSVYRRALDHYFEDPGKFVMKDEYFEELKKVSNRGYCTGFYFGYPGKDDHNISGPDYHQEFNIIGLVLSTNDRLEGMRVELRGKIMKGDSIEVLTPSNSIFDYRVDRIVTENGCDAELAQPNSVVYLYPDEPYPEYSMLRSRVK
ncbi:U32 family peptidase [bacterium]|nr:U32 family peptidase [bacterium]